MVCSTLSSEVAELVAEVTVQLTVRTETLLKVKEDFLNEMQKGWEAGQGAGAPCEASSLKMLTSHVNVLPHGHESGVFYALDLGGTNLRVLRVKLAHGCQPEVSELRRCIPRDIMRGTADELFDFMATTAKELTEQHKDAERMPAGFTFSFPMSQSAINKGNLIEWTKGFCATGCVGEDPAALLTQAMERHDVPLDVAALCNDTVGTLMTCAYEFEGCGTCKIGMIIGTGTNAAYSDPTLGNLVVNIEWGGYDFKNVDNVLVSFDKTIDETSPNPGRQLFEKTISGMYLGDLTRLATLEVLKDYSGELPEFLSKTLDTKFVCDALDGDDLGCSDELVMNVFRAVGDLVLTRSAALCAAALAAVSEKCNPPSANKRHMREVCIEHGMPRALTIGVDGSLFQKGHRYQERLNDSFAKIVGKANASLIHTVHSNDGSGVGAALVAAAISR